MTSLQTECVTFVSHRWFTLKYVKVGLLALLSFTASMSSWIAWKASDVDFAERLGSDMLCEAYVCIALALFLSSSLVLLGLRWLTPKSIFFKVQQYSWYVFGALAACESLFQISQSDSMTFFLKVTGYVYSSLVVNSFWIATSQDDEDSEMTSGQLTLYCLCSYLGVAAAGVWLQSETIGSSQLGLLVMCCSAICWMLGKLAFGHECRQPFIQHSETAEKTGCSPVQTLFRAMTSSSLVLSLVVVSILLNVLVSSTEYYFIADFESRYLSLNDSPSATHSLGSFVLLIGLGNILSLTTTRLFSRFHIGRAGIPFAAILSAMMMRIGFSEGNSLLTAVLSLLVVESLYPLLVESNMQYLLAHFPESERISARLMIDTIAEPVGLLLSAMLLVLPWFDIHVLGIGVVCVAVLLIVFSFSVDSRWRARQLASFKQMFSRAAARYSVFAGVCKSSQLPLEVDEAREGAAHRL
jgi:hypothetical protein